MPKDDATWLNIVYVASGILLAYLVWKALENLGIQTYWIEKYDWFSLACTPVALVSGVVGVWYVRRNQERHEFLLSAIAELRKVSWPSVDDTKRMTVIVGVVVAIMSVILSIFDFFWGRFLKWIIS